MPTSKVHPARSVVPAATASKSTKASAKKPAAAKAKTSNSPSAGKGLPRKARKPASLPKSEGDAGVLAYIASMEPWQAAIAKCVARREARVRRPQGREVAQPILRRRGAALVPRLRSLPVPR
jgi:hypothetical protein